MMTMRFVVVYTLGGLLALSAASFGSAEGSGDWRRELAVLRAAVLADPFDAGATTRLTALRERERTDRSEGLAALADGLRAYLDGRYDPAVTALRRACQSPDAEALAGSVLLTPLDRVRSDCELAAGAAVCEKCGGTGRADCATCSGSGWQRCPNCRGRGEVRQGGVTVTRGRRGSYRTARATWSACPSCGGIGVVVCPSCAGSGVVICEICANHPAGGGGGPALGTNARRAVEEAIAMARALADGELDLYSPEAMAPSPKLPSDLGRR